MPLHNFLILKPLIIFYPTIFLFFSDRPSVEECLQHPWISRHSEPPSPSPLMLKIPAPDHFVTSSNKLSVHHHPTPSPSGSSRRSCQTCRDKLSERKRYLSKSREAIFEKVTNSNLKKSLSKSRERLCDMRLTLGKSREYLNNESKLASRSQEKFYNFKSISKSKFHSKHHINGRLQPIGWRRKKREPVTPCRTSNTLH